MLCIKFYPRVAFWSQNAVYLADGTEVPLLQLALAYNELRDALEQAHAEQEKARAEDPGPGYQV